MSKHLESPFENLLNGKLPHNLSWSEAVELVEHLGEVQLHGGDEFVFRVGAISKIILRIAGEIFQRQHRVADSPDGGSVARNTIPFSARDVVLALSAAV